MLRNRFTGMVISSLFCLFLITNLSGQNLSSQLFEEYNVTGSVTVYDVNQGKFISNDIVESNISTLPASTFKIINTMIALETGAISGVDEVFKWPGSHDSLKYGIRPEIYRDLTVREAFKISAVWVYLEIAKRIGYDNYMHYLEACDYGNGIIPEDCSDFWNFGDFAVTPAEQISLVEGIYNETLPFSQSTFKAIKDIMTEESRENFVLRAKTGMTNKDEKSIGWWVGYIETNNDTFCFATRIYKDRNDNNPEFMATRKSITKEFLKLHGIL